MCGDAVSTTHQLLSFSIVTQMCGDAVSTTHQLLSFRYCYADVWWCGFHHTSTIILQYCYTDVWCCGFHHTSFIIIQYATPMCGDAVSITFSTIVISVLQPLTCGFAFSIIFFSLLTLMCSCCVAVSVHTSTIIILVWLTLTCGVAVFPLHIKLFRDNYYFRIYYNRYVVYGFSPIINQLYHTRLWHWCCGVDHTSTTLIFRALPRWLGDLQFSSHELLLA